MVEQTDARVSFRSKVVTHWRVILDTVATVSMIAVCITLVWVLLSNRRVALPAAAAQPNPAGSGPARPTAPAPLPKEPLSLRGAALLGQPSAKVAIVQYSDFQCPYCAVFARDTLPQLTERYVKSGKVLVAFRHLPLTQIHPFAVKAGEAAECAGRQGKFWEMHDAMFQNQKQLDEANLIRLANKVGLEAGGFDTCLKGEAASRVKEDLASAGPLVVSGTPTFFVGTLESDGRVKVTERLTGALPIQQFEAVLEKLLSGAKTD